MKIQILALLILLATGHGMHASWVGRDDFEDGIILDSCRVDFPNENGDTPLMNAIFKNDIQKIKQLIASGANVNRRGRTFGNTPLHTASCWNQIKVVPLLIAVGAEINQQNFFGSTPLHYAPPHRKITQLLIDAGADQTIRNYNGEIAMKDYYYCSIS